MPISKGDFVLVEYEIYIKGTEELVDTTNAELAKKYGVFDPHERYGPRLIIVGEGRFIKGLEEALEGLEEGNEKEIEIPPEKAFGQRDPSKVKIMSRNVFIRHGINPEPGKTVEIDGQYAVIRQVTGGRVVVDFNHPLAGKTLYARIRVVRVLKSVEDKIKHLLLRRAKQLGEDEIKTNYDEEKKHVLIELPSKALEIPELQVAKRIVVLETAKYLRDRVETMDFVEHVSLAETIKEDKTIRQEK